MEVGAFGILLTVLPGNEHMFYFHYTSLGTICQVPGWLRRFPEGSRIAKLAKGAEGTKEVAAWKCAGGARTAGRGLLSGLTSGILVGGAGAPTTNRGRAQVVLS